MSRDDMGPGFINGLVGVVMSLWEVIRACIWLFPEKAMTPISGYWALLRQGSFAIPGGRRQQRT